jgi:hypothetical protein
MATGTVHEPLALAYVINVLKYDMPVAPPSVYMDNVPIRREHV